jgi:hypothetical protein
VSFTDYMSLEVPFFNDLTVRLGRLYCLNHKLVFIIIHKMSLLSCTSARQLYSTESPYPLRHPVTAAVIRDSKKRTPSSCVILLCTSNFHLHHLTLRSRPALGKISTDPSCFRQDATLRKILRKYVHLSAHGKLR